MGSLKLIFSLFVAAFSIVSGLYTWNNNRVVSGGLASQGQFPYVASITENGRHFCGGFIYSSRWVVTAASCVEGKQLNALNVVVGQLSTINPDINEQTMVVYTVTIFPEYNNTNKLNDIALIRLTTDIQFDKVNVDFIVYEEANYKIYSLVMGWGATFEGGFESVNLRYGAVQSLPMNVSTNCGNFLKTEFDFAATICAGGTLLSTYPGGSPCQYDEGSPLVQDFVDPNTLEVFPVAVGIFSKTKTCAFGSADGIGIYTRLSVFYSWLLGTAGPQPARLYGIR